MSQPMFQKNWPKLTLALEKSDDGKWTDRGNPVRFMVTKIREPYIARGFVFGPYLFWVVTYMRKRNEG
jgi:hypothetical protein